MTMHEFPHQYTVSAAGLPSGDVELTSAKLTAIRSASPAEFDGPGDRWSPETLLVGAVADCFILTFRAIARASKLPWNSLRCQVTGRLDRVDRVTQFTEFVVTADLDVPAGTNEDLARRALDKAEHQCLISNSLKGAIRLVAHLHATEQESETMVA
jgi:organic hydroperoxide reductase OsmC/OhrA